MPEVIFPFTCSLPAARLPRRALDGQTICDIEGNIWQFESASDSWVNRGALTSPPLVSEEQDGLVTPDVFRRIDAIKTATGSGRALPEELKLKPNIEAYWYLFHSSDKLIRFIPEGVDALRIEIDRGRLFTLIVGSACRGPKGLTGEKGLKGRSGAPGGVEPCFEPISISADGTVLSFQIVVPAPLDTDISLRLSSSATDSPAVIIAITPATGKSRLVSADPSVTLDTTRTLNSITYVLGSQALSGSFFRTVGKWSERCVLARQKGPTGDKGDPGSCILQPKECQASYTDLQFTDPIIGVRRGCNSNQLLTVSGNLFDKVCVSKLSFDVASPDYANLFTGGMVTGRALAAHRTLDPCKDVGVFTPSLVVAERPALELPEWRPQQDCNVAKRAQLSDVNWVPLTDIPATDTLWEVPSGLTSPHYPWQIMVPSATDAGHCDPCDEAHSVDPPCPSGQTTATTTTPAPIIWQLRSHAVGDCSCQQADEPLGVGDVALNNYSSLTDCQRGQLNICGDSAEGVQYQLRYDVDLKQCSCLNAADPLADSQSVLGLFNSLLECEEQRNLNPVCSGGAPAMALWFSIADGSCYCIIVGAPSQSHQDILLGAYVAQADCADICMPDISGGGVVWTCAGAPATGWRQFVTGQISYNTSATKNVGLMYNAGARSWSMVDDDRTTYTFKFSNTVSCVAQLTVKPFNDNPFVLTSNIQIVSGQVQIAFTNNIKPSFKLVVMRLFGTVVG